MAKVETLMYVSKQVFGKEWNDLNVSEQKVILDRKDSKNALSHLISEKNFQELKRNKYISL
jgi:hypothetical protein